MIMAMTVESMIGPSWPVEGYFGCAGGSLFVEINCLGKTFQTRTASHSLTIAFPRHTDLPHRDGEDSHSPLVRPPWKFVRADTPTDTEPSAGHDDEWGAVATDWGPGEDYPSYALVDQLIFYTELAASDQWDFRKSVSALGREVDEWWVAFTDWLDVLTVQDFSLLGGVPPSILASGFHGWSGDASNQRHTPCGSAMFTVPSNPGILSADHVHKCMYLSERARRPPTEWLLIRDARSLSHRGDHRRAVLDAGSAAELALTALLETHLYPSGEAIKDAMLNRYRTLGGLKDLASMLIPDKVPDQMTSELIEPRNIAVHKAADPVSRETAQKAIDKAAELVEFAHPIGIAPGFP